MANWFIDIPWGTHVFAMLRPLEKDWSYFDGSTMKQGNEEWRPCKISGVNSGQGVRVSGCSSSFDLNNFEIGPIMSAYNGEGDSIELKNGAVIKVRCFGSEIDFQKIHDHFNPSGDRANELPDGWCIEGFDDHENAVIFTVYGAIGEVDDEKIRELMASAYSPNLSPAM